MKATNMRQLLRCDRGRAEELLQRYYPLLEQAFPLEGEIEEVETYLAYLESDTMEWNMQVQISDDGDIVGGLQYQILRGIAGEVQVAAWIEHVWLRGTARNFQDFANALRSLVDELRSEGVQMIFMEFNDPLKMTPEQIEDDAKGGILTNDRLKLWAYVGIHELISPNGATAPYAQPGMDGQPPVEYLSVGWHAIDGGGMEGRTLSSSSYLAVIERAHGTIPGVDTQTNGTSCAVRQLVAACGTEVFSFAPLRRRFES
ncbi:MAG: hypothetical protein KDD44_15370 [Bdellovibrionales bacterium]|nr:hypothetical protein [Bdellovibrionales bacterium]